MAHLCETFRRQSGSVWNKMRKASALGLSLAEETITELMLYEIARAHQGGVISVIPATKPMEFRHGADWEWWLTSGNTGISFRVQAKRLFLSGYYDSLFKKGPKQFQQHNKLVSASASAGHVPLYCFYNFDHPASSLRNEESACFHNYNKPSFWGCSVAHPSDVRSIGSNHIGALAASMIPLHYIACLWLHGLLGGSLAIIANLQQARPWPEHGKALRSALEAASPRAVPDYVGRLRELGRQRRGRSEDRPYVDQEFWEEAPAVDANVVGVVIFDDTREGRR